VFWKLTLTIIVLGFAATLLLVDRQQRLDLAAEMSRTHQRMGEHERALWRLRTDIAFRTRPDRIRAEVDRLDLEWEPLHDRLALAQERERDRADGLFDPPSLADEFDAYRDPASAGEELR